MSGKVYMGSQMTPQMQQRQGAVISLCPIQQYFLQKRRVAGVDHGLRGKGEGNVIDHMLPPFIVSYFYPLRRG